MNKPTNKIRAITPELVALHSYNTAVMMREVFSGLRTPKPMPPEKRSAYLTMGEFVTELPDPALARISSHFIVTPNFSTDDIVTLLLLHSWCNENGVTRKVFCRKFKDVLLSGKIRDPGEVLRTDKGVDFIKTIDKMCDDKSRWRIEKRTSEPSVLFFVSSILRWCMCGTHDEYDGSPNIAPFIFCTDNEDTPVAITVWGANTMNAYLAIMGGGVPSRL